MKHSQRMEDDLNAPTLDHYDEFITLFLELEEMDGTFTNVQLKGILDWFFEKQGIDTSKFEI